MTSSLGSPLPNGVNSTQWTHQCTTIVYTRWIIFDASIFTFYVNTYIYIHPSIFTRALRETSTCYNTEKVWYIQKCISQRGEIPNKGKGKRKIQEERNRKRKGNWTITSDSDNNRTPFSSILHACQPTCLPPFLCEIHPTPTQCV